MYDAAMKEKQVRIKSFKSKYLVILERNMFIVHRIEHDEALALQVYVAPL